MTDAALAKHHKSLNRTKAARTAVRMIGDTQEFREKDDFYETPPEGIAALLAVEKFDGPVWEPACGRGAGPRLFKSFTDWWTEFGEARARESAREVNGFDADILTMVSPSLQAKVAMQERRNLEKIRRRRQADFDREFSLSGVFRWWP